MSESRKRDILVIGGGAAGLIAAIRAAQKGARVTLLEKNVRLGMKILISGGGKCNLTHAGSMEQIRAEFRPAEARFLKPAFYRFTNDQFLALLHDGGIRTYARPDGRIFPVEPHNARDVVAALEHLVRAAGVFVRLDAPVNGLVIDPVQSDDIEKDACAAGDKTTDRMHHSRQMKPGVVSGQVVGVRVDETVYEADRVIVAVGGSSYAATGTTGDGWRWAASAGHTLAPLRAALAPLYLEAPKPDWSGIALREVVLRARTAAGGKEYARWRGDLLFTHKGLSGPCALGISREVAERMASEARSGGVLEVDLAPDMTFEDLQKFIAAQLREGPRKCIGTIIAEYIPERLRDAFIAALGVDPMTRGAHLSNKALNQVTNAIKGWSLGSVRSVPLERGEVVAGGVSLDEVNPQTMESRLVRGLYLCGEILDIAGPVGGYNLQAAWSTGYIAGDSAAHPTIKGHEYPPMMGVIP